MALKALPRSKAKTAWGLMADVKRAILAEPKRADMTSVIGYLAPTEGGPACGTVGCVAGWVAVLGRKYPSPYEIEMSNAVGVARALLGEVNYFTVGQYGHYVFNAGAGDACDTTNPNTPAHARAVAKRIDKFMRVNEKALKARKLPVLNEGASAV